VTLYDNTGEEMHFVEFMDAFLKLKAEVIGPRTKTGMSSTSERARVSSWTMR
jgi:hypothetical protein